VIGVLDTTDAFDPMFKKLSYNDKMYYKAVSIEENVFSIVDKLVQIFIAMYKDAN